MTRWSRRQRRVVLPLPLTLVLVAWCAILGGCDLTDCNLDYLLEIEPSVAEIQMGALFEPASAALRSDCRNDPVPLESLRWEADDSGVLEVDPTTGLLRGLRPGTAIGLAVLRSDERQAVQLRITVLGIPTGAPPRDGLAP